MDNGMVFQAYFFITRLFSSMLFLAQMNNKRDTIFWNIKINRVIIPTHEQRALGPVTETRKHSVENSLYRPNCENYLNWGALPPAPLLGGASPPTTPFSNITFLN